MADEYDPVQNLPSDNEGQDQQDSGTSHPEQGPVEAQAPTHFALVAMTNAIAGNEWNGGWPAVDKQIEIVKSEMQELVDGIAARDINELRDGIADVLYTVYGLAARAGIDADSDLFDVITNNISKFDETSEDALLTREKYAAINIVTVMVAVTDRVNPDQTYFVTKSAYDQVDASGRSYPEGKWLKSHNWKEPVFAALPLDVDLMLATVPMPAANDDSIS